MRTDYSWAHCEWCGKTVFTDELVTKIISGHTWHLCEFCSEYNSFNEVKVAYALLIAEGMESDDLWWM